MGLEKGNCTICGRRMLIATDKTGAKRKPPYYCGRKSCKKTGRDIDN